MKLWRCFAWRRRREEMFSRESRPLKRPRLGIPDFYPQENKQKEVRSRYFPTNNAQFPPKLKIIITYILAGWTHLPDSEHWISCESTFYGRLPEWGKLVIIKYDRVFIAFIVYGPIVWFCTPRFQPALSQPQGGEWLGGLSSIRGSGLLVYWHKLSQYLHASIVVYVSAWIVCKTQRFLNSMQT